MRSARLSWIVVLAAFLTVLSACHPVMPEPAAGLAATAVADEETAPAVVEGAAHVSVSGLEIALPVGWATVDDAAGFMLVASSPDLLSAEDLLPVQDGVLMMFLNMSKDELPSLPLPDLLGIFIDSRALPAEITSGPEEITIGSAAAIAIAGKGDAEGVPFLYLAAGIETESRVGRLIAVLPQKREEELRPLVESVISSVVVSEPTPMSVDLSVIEGEIESGHPVSATLEPDTTMIWHFTGTEGQLVIVSAAPTATLDIVVGIVDAAGAPVGIGESDSQGAGEAERKLFTLPTGGDYYVVVRGFTGSGGDFSVAVTETSIAGKIESADEMLGTWGAQGTIFRFGEDGIVRVASDEASLQTEPIYQGHYQVEDGLFTLGRNEIGDLCADSDAVYEGVLLAGGELSLHHVEDRCPPRASILTDVVLPPTQE